MTAQQIREAFLSYFKKQGHRIVPSSPVVPADDPTLLFTNAGMNQFKPIFLGQETRDYSRAASAQKCIRVSGKHNDLEEVGRDSLHHTFFEMLGNWSFGDYYKKEAIEFAWEFLTVDMGLDKDRLWASVYTDDDEAAGLWPRVTDLPADRVLRFGAKENFWEMGETGPCGPCSELHYDRGEEFSCGKPDCGVNCGCERFLEIWNLVFIQYDRDRAGKLTELPAKHVDTGMGLERLTAIKQGVDSNYGTDLFRPIIERIIELSGQDESDRRLRTSMWVIADHIRALTFAIADGAMPSNEGRGYVLRRILRRAARHGRILDLHQPFIYGLSGTVVDIMGQAYPELHQGREHVALVIQAEEERFGQTLDQGIERFEELSADLERQGAAAVPGEEAFRLYDTYGFPVDLTRVMAREKGLEVDIAGFEKAMEAQRTRSRVSTAETGEETAARDWKTMTSGGSSVFIGYETFESSAVIRKWAAVGKGENSRQVEVILDRTPFYAQAGGQTGDSGSITGDGFTVEVGDVILRHVDGQDEIVHTGRLTEGSIASPEVTAAVRSGRRMATARNHTATHLLQAALRRVLGDHVHQSGSLVSPERLRFDFTHFAAMTPDELRSVEELVNEHIRRNRPVTTRQTSLEQARREGVTALFGEKYDDQVRVVEVAGTSQELCGGTHVGSTGEIGLFQILGESGIAAGVRRIEALTGEAALEWIGRQRSIIDQLSARLKVDAEGLTGRVDKLLETNRELDKKLKRAATQKAVTRLDDILEGAREVDDVPVVAHRVEAGDRAALLKMADALREKLPDGAGLLGMLAEDRLQLVAVVGDRAQKEHGLKAGDIIRRAAAVAGGKGGGKPHLAQGGGGDPEKLGEVLEAVPEIIKTLLSEQVGGQ